MQDFYDSVLELVTRGDEEASPVAIEVDEANQRLVVRDERRERLKFTLFV